MKKILIFILLVTVSLWVGNTSIWIDPLDTSHKWIAHRGVHQTYHHQGLKNDTCTASRIDVPSHGYLENTIASMRSAFDHGASVVEIDIHLIKDNRFIVFHDWGLECRTNGTGVTRKQSVKYLQSLDIGYGYTADAGKTYPFRGKGLGQMPTMSEVFTAFPKGKFLLNFKSNMPQDGQKLVAVLKENLQWKRQVWGVYGGHKPIMMTKKYFSDMAAFSKSSMKACLQKYLALGWTGYVPNECRNQTLIVPINYASILWGWPNRFHKRMHGVGTVIILDGPYTGHGTVGINSLDMLPAVKGGFDYIWTNKIEIVGTKVQKSLK